jgi:hypothetical protein
MDTGTAETPGVLAAAAVILIFFFFYDTLCTITMYKYKLLRAELQLGGKPASAALR